MGSASEHSRSSESQHFASLSRASSDGLRFSYLIQIAFDVPLGGLRDFGLKEIPFPIVQRVVLRSCKSRLSRPSVSGKLARLLSSRLKGAGARSCHPGTF